MTALGSAPQSPAPDKPPVRGKEFWMAVGLLAAVLVLAAALRFVSIGARSLWLDEAVSAQMAGLPARELVARVAAEDTHPPLYYLLLSRWTRIFGDTEAGLRSPGAIASTLIVVGTWWLGRRLGGPWVGVIAAVLAAVAPLQVLAAQEARMYPLLGLLTVVSWSALLAALEGSRRGWVLYAAATVLALYTHYFAFLSLAGQGVFVLFTAPRLRQQWLASQFVAVVCYLPWLGRFMDTFVSGRGWPFIRPPVGPGTLTGLAGLFSFGGHVLGFDGYFGSATAPVAAQLAILVPFLAIACAGAVLAWRRQPAALLIFGYLVVPVVLAFSFSLRHNVFYARYFSFVFPAFAVLMALGIIRVADWFTPTLRRAAVLGLVLTLVGLNGLVLNEVRANPRHAYFNWRGAAALLIAQAGPGDLIVAFPGFGKTPLSYYFKGPQRIEPMTPREFYERMSGPLAPDLALAARNRAVLRSYAARHEVMWVVTSLPLPQASMERLGGLLSGIYDARSVADFNGVRVFKMTRNPGWETAR